MDLKKILSNERYEHSVRTEQMAKILCEKYNIDTKAVLAAYYHDIAKELSLEEMISLVGDKFKDDIDGIYQKNILHGFAGAEYLKKYLNITDEEILSAVRYHTVGKKNMSDIEKIVYISDGIEYGRNYEGVEKIREEVFKDLNKGILMELNYKLKMLVDRNVVIHKNTVEFRNQLLKEVKNVK
ncbi:bis(5'-nucleosyl)-tetraphosphatase (symmetrical) YqeK [Oceanivirga salmonicida]|uniref:bis(5'-nucleosyl)-tetraphosphatase (symmetrical) YqeK n=1 Tax=Oceanivirga salmonicida TaxID=1769291 RepID=UPI0018CC257D|nr:bis(5'-nucleosyl)-tetraphosphatase (symmetrical) YqeK [Oceanivirga salmonicida]